MKISIFSNYFNVHQLPIAAAISTKDKADFHFVSVCANQSNIVGRMSLDDKYPYVIRAYEGDAERDIALVHAAEDDIVVFGELEGHEEYVEARVKTGKPFFRFTERILKRGDWWRFALPKMWRTHKRFNRYKNYPMYILCGSAYASRDLALSGFPAEKCLKWGYFPDVQICHASYVAPRGYKSLCSAQRLIALKRVDLQIRLASKLKQKGYAFHLSIAGNGPERVNLEKLAAELDVADCVEFLGELTHDETIQLMRDSEIFLATSNRKEGWGATVNEAMASGCCVVASDAMGSVPFLIKNGENGFSFPDGRLDDLANIVCGLLEDDAIVRTSGERARHMVTTGQWSAEAAASALMSVSASWLDEGAPTLPEFGPMSPAPLYEGSPRV